MKLHWRCWIRCIINTLKAYCSLRKQLGWREMQIREGSVSRMRGQDLAWISARQPEQLPILGVLPRQRPRSSRPYHSERGTSLGTTGLCSPSHSLAAACRDGTPGRSPVSCSYCPQGWDQALCEGHRAVLGGRWSGRNGWPTQPSIRSADALQGLQIPLSFLGNKGVCVWKCVQEWLCWSYACCLCFVQRLKILRVELKSHSWCGSSHIISRV